MDWGADIDTVLAASDANALEVRLSALYQEPWQAVGRARDRGVEAIRSWYDARLTDQPLDW